MTWEQEMKYQARELAQELAPEIAREMAVGMAKDIAKDMAKDMAEEMAEEAAKEKVKETALNLLRLNVADVDQIAQVTGLSVGEIKELNSTLQSAQA